MLSFDVGRIKALEFMTEDEKMGKSSEKLVLLEHLSLEEVLILNIKQLIRVAEIARNESWKF
jgi:hypothetical protein